MPQSPPPPHLFHYYILPPTYPPYPMWTYSLLISFPCMNLVIKTFLIAYFSSAKVVLPQYPCFDYKSSFYQNISLAIDKLWFEIVYTTVDPWLCDSCHRELLIFDDRAQEENDDLEYFLPSILFNIPKNSLLCNLSQKGTFSTRPSQTRPKNWPVNMFSRFSGTTTSWDSIEWAKISLSFRLRFHQRFGLSNFREGKASHEIFPSL